MEKHVRTRLWLNLEEMFNQPHDAVYVTGAMGLEVTQCENSHHPRQGDLRWEPLWNFVIGANVRISPV